MNYKTIDKALNLYSCGVNDLTVEHREQFKKQCVCGESFKDITVFYDIENTAIVLNEEHEYFDLSRDFVIAYLSAEQAGRNLVKIENQRKNTKYSQGIIKILDVALVDIKAKQEFLILEKIPCGEFKQISDVIKGVFALIQKYTNCHCPLMPMQFAYLYGIIQGKRKERARKK